MSLSSAGFLFLFLPIVLTFFLLLPARVRSTWLLVASLVFFAWSARSYVLVLLLAIAVNYLVALLCLRSDPSDDRRKPARRAALLFLVVFDLGILVVSRYGSDAMSRLAVRYLGAAGRRGIPTGASFFCLAMISYALDTYRRKVAPERDPFKFGLYVAFFSKIVAGPIVRYRDVAAQLGRPRLTRTGLAIGMERFIVGLAKKLLIADVLAITADEIFSAPASGVSGPAAWLGAVCYALQIYYDFSGYSDMAIGLGRMFGLEFLENFDHPYVSKSLAEFWRRWHISLSTFLRDYIYLPLAYAISRRIQSERIWRVKAEMWSYAGATLCTMLLCGLWHRVALGCAIWGLWHGVFLVIENTRKGKRMLRRSGRTGRYLITQWAILMGWVFFRAPSLGRALGAFRAMYWFRPAGAPAPSVTFGLELNRPLMVALFFAILFSPPWVEWARRWGATRLSAARRPPILALAAGGRVILLLVVLFLSAMTLAGATYTPFIYQQF